MRQAFLSDSSESESLPSEPSRLSETYLARSPRSAELTEQEKELLQLLQEHLDDPQTQVQTAVNNWNLAVRSHLRRETALNLNKGDDQASIPVRVVDRLSEPLRGIVNEQYSYDLWVLLLNQPMLQETVKGLDVILEAFPYVQNWPVLNTHNVTKPQISAVAYLVNNLANELRRMELLQRLKSIRVDVLGAYFFFEQRVQLFWMAIAIYARLLDVSIAGLTTVVLAHELAHAYIHLGFDIDGEQWDTWNFSEADLHITEGHAQFYTETVCTRLADRIPTAHEAFTALLTFQTDPYKIFQQWSPKSSKRGEVVRAAMLHARTHNTTRYTNFEKTLQEQENRLKRR